MTVQYSLTAATASFCKFLKLLLRWKGSVWKLVLFEVSVWLTLTTLWIVAYIVGSRYSENFNEACDRMILRLFSGDRFNDFVTLLVGFTTNLVLTRWLDIYRLLVWPDNLCQMFNAFCMDSALKPNESALLRKNFIRYLTLSYVLIMRDISPVIRTKYPTFDELVNAQLATKEDVAHLRSSGLNPEMCHFWVPLLWIVMQVKKHYRPGTRNFTESGEPVSIMSEMHFQAFVSETIRVRGWLGDLLSYDWVPIPLAIFHLNQICCYVALVHNVFVVTAPIARESNAAFQGIGVGVTLLVTLARIIFYVGWLKCMGVVLNPFGRDDDDFELAFYLWRHGEIIKNLLESPIERLPDGASQNIKMGNYLTHTLASAITAVTTMPEKHLTVQNSTRNRNKSKTRKPAPSQE